MKCQVLFQPPAKVVFAYLTHTNFPHVLGAVSLAVSNINKDSSILPNTTLAFKFEPLSNSQLHSLRIMTEKRDQGVSAFIGPDEFCRNEAMVASAWNLPMIAFVSYFTSFYLHCKYLHSECNPDVSFD